MPAPKRFTVTQDEHGVAAVVELACCATAGICVHSRARAQRVVDVLNERCVVGSRPDRIEAPSELLPPGASISAFDPIMLRASAEAYNRGPHREPAPLGEHAMTIKAWVVLYLLDRSGLATPVSTTEASSQSSDEALGTPGRGRR